MRECNRIADPKKQPETIRQRSRLIDEIIQTPAPSEFHSVVDPPIGKKRKVVYRQNPGMLEARNDSSFVQHPFLNQWIWNRSMDHFDRNQPIQVAVLCQVHGTHSALASKSSERIS